jgi:hypothetical protein
MCARRLPATSTPFGHAAGTGAQAIDISGDGASNQGRLVTAAWDKAVAQAVTINGLPLMLKQPDSLWDIEDLDLYFCASIIGGPDALMIPVREKHQFAEAIRTKVLCGIAEQPRPLVQRTQEEAPTTCLAGELGRRQRSGN